MSDSEVDDAPMPSPDAANDDADDDAKTNGDHDDDDSIRSKGENGTDEASSSIRTGKDGEEEEEDKSIMSGSLSPVSHATAPHDEEEEDYEVDSEADKAVVEGNSRRKPKMKGYYRQLDEGTMDYGEDVEEIERSYSPATSTSSTGPKKQRAPQRNPHITKSFAAIDPRWLVPFEHGWRRQVIIRNTGHDGFKKAADTYYLPPTGRKIRSMPGIEQHLKDTLSELSAENFTFRKEPIYKEPLETVRKAKEGTGAFKKRSPKGEGDSASTKRPSPKTEVVSVTNSVLTVHKLQDKAGGKIRAVAKKHTGKRSNHQVFEGESPAKKSRVENGGEGVANEEQRLCGLDCPGRGGGPPSLHCEVCMCLFHPQCVGFDLLMKDGFICKACHIVENNLLDGKSKASPSPTPVMPPVSSKPSTPSLPPMRPRPKSLLPVTPNTTSVTPAAPPLALKPTSAASSSTPSSSKPPKLPVKIPASFDPNNISGQLITLPPSLTSKLNLSKSVNLKWNGQSYIIPPNCFISTPEGLKVLLPSGTLSNISSPGSSVSAQVNTGGGLNLVNTQALATSTMNKSPRTLGQLTSVLTPTSQSVSSSSSSSAARSIVPPRTSTTQVITPSSTTPSPSPVGSTTRRSISPTEARVIAISPEPGATAPAEKTPRIKNVPKCHFLRLQVGFDAMLHIFSFLGPLELLRVSSVCRTWNQAASYPGLWRTVHLRKLNVTNWNKAATFFRAHNTQTLDMRGISVSEEDRSRLWHEFTGAMRQLTCVQYIKLPQCPGLVVQTLAETLPELRGVEAQAITDATQADKIRSTNSKVDVAKFGKVCDLQELRLRGVCGLQLPSFSFSGGLSELASLKQLQTLSLTTLREVTDLEFNFLSSLTELETLELGDCYLWRKSTYEQLQDLTKLRTLRLECGDVTDGLGPSLQTLTQLTHLELIRFPVSEELSTSLQKMTTLTQLCIWPDTEEKAAEVNSNTRTAVCNMSFLQELEWGLTSTDNTLMFQGEDEQEDASIGINELVDKLHSSLPKTSIRVFKVPALKRN